MENDVRFIVPPIAKMDVLDTLGIAHRADRGTEGQNVMSPVPQPVRNASVTQPDVLNALLIVSMVAIVYFRVQMTVWTAIRKLVIVPNASMDTAEESVSV